MELSPQIINGIISVFSAVSGAVGAYLVAKRKEKENLKKSANSDFEIIQRANEKFREEIRGDWVTARGRISALESDIQVKHKEIEELKNSIVDLKSELAIKDKRISDMKIEIMKRDLQIEDLKAKISDLSKRTTDAMTEMQNLQQRHFPEKTD